MHEHVGKRAKMQRCKENQTGGTKQARQVYLHHTEWRKVWIKHTNTTEVYLTSGYTQTSLRRDVCNHKKQVALGIDKHKPTKGTKHSKA